MTERLHFHSHFHFTEDSGSEKLSDLPKLTQLNSNIIMILLHVSLIVSLWPHPEPWLMGWNLI